MYPDEEQDGPSVATKSTQEAKIPQALAYQDEEINGLFKAVSVLETRLRQITEPQVNKGDTAKEVAPTPPNVFEKIDRNARKISQVTSQIKDITSRLHV